jgi:hypothetical protein
LEHVHIREHDVDGREKDQAASGPLGEDVTDFVVAVMTKEPDWTALPAATPPRIVELLRRCLKKDPRERLRDIGDARIEIDEAQRGPTSHQKCPTPLADRSGHLWLPRRSDSCSAWLLMARGVRANDSRPSPCPPDLWCM